MYPPTKRLATRYGSCHFTEAYKGRNLGLLYWRKAVCLSSQSDPEWHYDTTTYLPLTGISMGDYRCHCAACTPQYTSFPNRSKFDQPPGQTQSRTRSRMD